MLEIGICDDDRLLLWEMEKRLCKLSRRLGIGMEILTYADGKEIVKEVSEGKHFDLIFMDIGMEQLDGLTAAESIREMDRFVQLIFVTSYESYMKEAFRSAPIGFLVKPVDEDEFTETFQYVLNLIEKEDQYYRFRYDRADYKVSLREVKYFESKRRMTEIECGSGRYRLYKSLEVVEEELKDQGARFVRIHKSYLVNYLYIARCSADFVELVDGTSLPVSRSRRKEVEENLYESMEWCHV